MPYFPTNSTAPMTAETTQGPASAAPGRAGETEAEKRERIRIKNRRKRFLDAHPEFFGPGLEAADPELYYQLIRRFQTPAEREAEGRQKTFANVIEARMMRSTVQQQAGASSSARPFGYLEAAPQEAGSERTKFPPMTKKEAKEEWVDEMQMRFLLGNIPNFDYKSVDDNEEWDDLVEEERDRLEAYFDDQEPSSDEEGGKGTTGDTGIMDY